METGQRFSFIVDKTIAQRINRVIAINDGRAVTVTAQGEDLIYIVERT
jgi:hypothetical protein